MPTPTDEPKPHQVQPHLCGGSVLPNHHAMLSVEPLDAETEARIGYAVYGPKNWLNVEQLRARIRYLLKRRHRDTD